MISIIAHLSSSLFGGLVITLLSSLLAYSQDTPQTTDSMKALFEGEWHIRYQPDNTQTYIIPLYIKFDADGLVAQDHHGQVIWQGETKGKDVSFRWTWLTGVQSSPGYILPTVDYIFSGEIDGVYPLGHHMSGTFKGLEHDHICRFPLNKPRKSFSEAYESCPPIEITGTWTGSKTRNTKKVTP